MDAATAFFAALADPIRLRCLALIVRREELCVCELVAGLDLPQPKISRHLAVLRDAGILRDRRDAQWVLYALPPDLAPWMRGAVDAAIMAIEETAQHRKDRTRLGRTCRPARLRTAESA